MNKQRHPSPDREECCEASLEQSIFPSAPTTKPFSTPTLKSLTGKSAPNPTSVGSSKLVRKFLLTADRHRLLKSGQVRQSPVSPQPRLGVDIAYATAPTNSIPTLQDNHIKRNVTDEDEEDVVVEEEDEARSPSTTASTPGSLDEESAVSPPLFRFVQGREDCINPVSRILWETTTYEEDKSSLDTSEDPSVACFRVVSPLSLDVAQRAGSSATLLARPMAVRPMLLA
ncbi:hypothetical protein ACA910_000368 [Epithemia clementina (nom. ined.)]